MGDKSISLGWWTPGDVARFFGVSTNTIVRMCDDQKVDCRRIGRGAHRQIPEHEVERIEQFLAVRKRKTKHRNNNEAGQIGW